MQQYLVNGFIPEVFVAVAEMPLVYGRISSYIRIPRNVFSTCVCVYQSENIQHMSDICKPMLTVASAACICSLYLERAKIIKNLERWKSKNMYIYYSGTIVVIKKWKINICNFSLFLPESEENERERRIRNKPFILSGLSTSTLWCYIAILIAISSSVLFPSFLNSAPDFNLRL